MALAAPPPLHTAAVPSWDETIVPALRKRLESESRALTKRMSAQSIPSGDENGPSYPSVVSRPPAIGRSVTDSRQLPPATNGEGRDKPSAIPRPSLQLRTAAEEAPRQSASKPSANGVKAAREPARKRSRTQSTPYPYERSPSAASSGDQHGSLLTSTMTQTSSGIPTPASSRAGSPMILNPAGRTGDVKPSRIPTAARTRSGSNSSHGHGVRPQLNEASPDLWPVAESASNSPPHSITTSIPNPKIRDEEPPFPRRTSADSVDRPFEHWYRGEALRNGGVGEVKVGRLEMLDIATYGHQRPGMTPSMRRRRAGSVTDQRESWLMPDREDELPQARVMDETPLTDAEADLTDLDASSSGHIYGLPSKPAPPPSLHPPPSKIPTASQPSQPSRSMTSLVAPATAPTPVHPTKPAPTTSAALPRTAQPSLPSTRTPTKKRNRTKSPVPQPKSRLPPDSGTPTNSLVDAIPPTMQTPAPQNGNWDEVVLPVVARRMGLEGYGIEEPVVGDGSPVKKKKKSVIIEPAPGTFAYDVSKVRGPRTNDLEMDDLGLRSNSVPVEEEQPQSSDASLVAEVNPSPQRPIKRQPSAKPESQRPPSPAPFSSYAPNDTPPSMPTPRRGKPDVPQIMVSPPSVRDEPKDEGAGCCKCVIM